MLKINGLNKRFDSTPVLNNVEFEIKKGEIFSILGPNGAGKSTTLKCIYGELGYEKGEILYDGQKINMKIKENIAVMPEQRFTFIRFKGNDYLELWKMMYPNFDEELFNKFILHYSIDLNKRVSKLSMGIKTLLYIALVISSNAELMILDEPTQNLDPVIRNDILNLFRDLCDEKEKTILITSHEVFELEKISDSFAIINEGKVVYSDDVDFAKGKHRMVSSNENLTGEVITSIGNEVLIKSEEEIGRYATFEEIVIGYLKYNSKFNPFKN